MFSLSFFTLPETAIQDILASVSGIFNDLSPLIFLLMGVFISFWVLGFVVSMTTTTELKHTKAKLKKLVSDIGDENWERERLQDPKNRVYSDDELFDFDDDDDDDY